MFPPSLPTTDPDVPPADQVPTYPTGRPVDFAAHYVRLLAESGAAEHIGANAFALCSLVAALEGAGRYAGRVPLFNNDILRMLGIGRCETLAKARARAVEAGWLYVDSGTTPHAYWVTVPAAAGPVPSGSPGDYRDGYRAGFSDGLAEGRALSPPLTAHQV